LLAAAERKISAGYKKQNHPFQAVVAKWLEQKGLLESFEVRPIAEHQKPRVFAMRCGMRQSLVSDHKNGPPGA